MKTRTLLTIAALFVSLLSYAQLSAEKKEKINQYLDLLTENNKVMGSLTLMQGNEVVYQKAFGVKQLDDLSTPNPETIYHVGSISKLYTSVLIHKLAEGGALSLNDKLSDYFPEVKNAEKITLSQLLNHRSGIYNFTNSSEYLALMEKPTNQAQQLEIIAAFDSDFEPGSKAEYSNSNYLLLGFIAEKATGKSFEQLLEQHIWKQVKAKHTSFGKNLGAFKNEATSYSYTNTGWTNETETHMSVPHAAGAIRSTPTDLVKFGRAIFQENLVSASSLASIIDIEEGYGRGIFEYPFYDKKAYGHDGGIDGFVSHMSHFPEEDFTIAAIYNGVNYDINTISIGVLSIYFDEEFELPDFSVADVDPAVIRSYAGKYASEDIPIEPILFEENGKLKAKTSENGDVITLRAESATIFKDDEAGVTITFDEENSFHFSQGGMETRFNKVDENEPEDEVLDTFSTDPSIFAGIYATDELPIDIEVFVKEGKVSAQATGQGELPLKRTGEFTFTYTQAGIEMIFDGKERFLLKQGGQEFTFTKK